MQVENNVFTGLSVAEAYPLLMFSKYKVLQSDVYLGKSTKVLTFKSRLT